MWQDQDDYIYLSSLENHTQASKDEKEIDLIYEFVTSTHLAEIQKRETIRFYLSADPDVYRKMVKDWMGKIIQYMPFNMAIYSNEENPFYHSYIFYLHIIKITKNLLALNLLNGDWQKAAEQVVKVSEYKENVAGSQPISGMLTLERDKRNTDFFKQQTNKVLDKLRALQKDEKQPTFTVPHF